METNTTPEPMRFNLREEVLEDFGTWLMRVQPRLEFLAKVVGRKSRTEQEQGLQEDLVAHIDYMLENLSDISLEVKELKIKAEEYHQDWMATETEKELAIGWSDKKKTVYDYVVKKPSNEARILNRLEAMVKTIDTRITVAQSMLRSLKP